MLALLALAAVVVAPVAVAAPASAAGHQPGLVGVPDGQIATAVPAYAAGHIPDRAAWDAVAASRGAGTLDVTVTTRAAARGRAAACGRAGGPTPPFCDDPELAVVLDDDDDHRGRTVALPLDAVREATGRTPRFAFGRHSSGDRWRSPTRVDGGRLLFDVPKFSTNTVTFSGTVTVAADPAGNGTTLAYDLADLDAASAPNVTLTGRVATDNDTESGFWEASGTYSPTVAGDRPPGPASLQLQWHIEGDALNPGAGLNAEAGATTSVTFSNPDDGIGRLECSAEEQDFTGDSAFSCQYSVDGGPWVTFASGTAPSGGSEKLFNSSLLLHPDSSLAIQWTNEDGNDLKAKVTEWSSETPDSVTVTINGTDYDFGAFGSGQSKTLSVDLGRTDDVARSWTDGGWFDYWLTYEERQSTPAAGVEINDGNWVNHTTPLDAGETVALVGDAAWLREGPNRVNVTAGDGSLSADAPAPVVGVTVEHDAASDQTVSYVAETWSERYNVSRTWASDRTAATVTVPFAGEVLAVRSAEVRTDGGAWTAVAASSIDMDGTTATVALGNVDANTTTTVRVNGSKAPAINGSYHVRTPTVLGDALATEIEVDSGPVAIDVSGTPDGARLHYLANATWDASERSRVTATGSNVLRLPDAATGDRATVRVLPLSPRPETGDVVVEPVDPDGTPEFSVSPGDATGDEVAWRYHATVSGHRYVLESVSAGAGRDSAVARSPVDLLDDDSSEVLRIYDDGEASTSDSGGPTGGGGGPVSAATSWAESTPVLFGAVLVGLLGVAYAGRRWLATWQQAALLVVGGAVGFVAVAERASGESVVTLLLDPIASGLGQTVPLVVLAGVVLVGYVVVQRVRGSSSDAPTVEIRGRFRR